MPAQQITSWLLIDDVMTAHWLITNYKCKTCGLEIINGTLHGVSKHVPVRILGSRFKARNCISEPSPQETYRDIF
jgi:hypothetical protein